MRPWRRPRRSPLQLGRTLRRGRRHAAGSHRAWSMTELTPVFVAPIMISMASLARMRRGPILGRNCAYSRADAVFGTSALLRAPDSRTRAHRHERMSARRSPGHDYVASVKRECRCHGDTTFTYMPAITGELLLGASLERACGLVS